MDKEQAGLDQEREVRDLASGDTQARVISLPLLFKMTLWLVLMPVSNLCVLRRAVAHSLWGACPEPRHKLQRACQREARQVSRYAQSHERARDQHMGHGTLRPLAVRGATSPWL